MPKDKYWDDNLGEWVQISPSMEEFNEHKAEKAHYPVEQPTNFQGLPDDGQVNLSWVNPPDREVKDEQGKVFKVSELEEIEIKRDGEVIYTGLDEELEDTGLNNNQEYTYEMVSITKAGVRSEPVAITVTPVPFTMDWTAGVTNAQITGATETGGQAILEWTNPAESDLAGILVRRGNSDFPATINEGTLVYDGLGETVIDSGLTNNQTYYYTIWAYNNSNQYSDDTNNIQISAEVILGDDPTGSPGPAVLFGGDMEAGYFGEVSSAELISGNALATEIGLSQGTAQNSDAGWLKFSYKGKIQFVAKKTFRHSVSWDAIASAGAVYGDGGPQGDAQVTLDGKNYKVRLMGGANADPYNYEAADRGAISSEWNDLMLPIHENSPSSFAYPDYVDSPTEDWGVNFSNEDLLTHNNFGSGSYSWGQETRSSDTARRVLRGYFGVSSAFSATSSITLTNYGWRPVLELL